MVEKLGKVKESKAGFEKVNFYDSKSMLFISFFRVRGYMHIAKS